MDELRELVATVTFAILETGFNEISSTDWTGASWIIGINTASLVRYICQRHHIANKTVTGLAMRRKIIANAWSSFLVFEERTSAAKNMEKKRSVHLESFEGTRKGQNLV